MKHQTSSPTSERIEVRLGIMQTHPTKILRQNQTPWEAKVWSVLRNRGIQDLKFRRQFQIGKYIVDFCCLEKKLVLELDGGHHSEPQNVGKDLERQKFKESKGCRVFRFWNTDVDNNLEGIIQHIIQPPQPHPNPLPNGRGD